MAQRQSVTKRVAGSRLAALFARMARADRRRFVWWAGIGLVRVVAPTVFAVLLGVASTALIQVGPWHGTVLGAIAMALVLQVLPPIHAAMSQNLGALTGAHLTDELTSLTTEPVGIGHLEDSELADDLNMAREFDHGVTAMPMFLSVDFVTAALVPFMAGWVSAFALGFYDLWLPFVLVAAWLFTHWAMRRSAAWEGRSSAEANDARRESQYYFDVAVQPPDAKEVRLFGLAQWVVKRFRTSRTRLLELQHHQMRFAIPWLIAAAAVVLAVNCAVFGYLGWRAIEGRPGEETITAIQLTVGIQAIAFGALGWAIDDAASPIAAIRRLADRIVVRRRDGGDGAVLDEVPAPPSASEPLAPSASEPSAPSASEPSQHGSGVRVRFEHVSFSYSGNSAPVLDNLSLDIKPGEALAIVGANAAGKTTLAKLLCRFYEPNSGAVHVDDADVAALDPAHHLGSVAAVFQDVLKLHLSVRANVDPSGALSDEQIARALDLAGLDLDPSTMLGKTQPGGTDLSGGQWQRIALARSICSVGSGAKVLLLDEPTASLDIRGELDVFASYLRHTAGATRILISHRFSTVRMTDRIAVLEAGKIAELGSHRELMDLGGRYAHMYQLQASRFEESR